MKAYIIFTKDNIKKDPLVKVFSTLKNDYKIHINIKSSDYRLIIYKIWLNKGIPYDIPLERSKIKSQNLDDVSNKIKEILNIDVNIKELLNVYYNIGDDKNMEQKPAIELNFSEDELKTLRNAIHLLEAVCGDIDKAKSSQGVTVVYNDTVVKVAKAFRDESNKLIEKLELK